MKRGLTLKREALAALDSADLANVAGGTWTGRVDCVVSIGRCVTNMFCTGPFQCWIEETA